MQHPHFYTLALHRLPEVGAVTYSRLTEQFGSPEQVLTAPIPHLQPLVKVEALTAIAEFQRRQTASPIAQKVLTDLEWLEAQPDTQLISLEDSNYPELLRHTPKPPPLLFVRGNIHCLNLPQIAIVGSRNPSSGGSENAHRFAEYLATNGFAITSGLALGVDAAAHQGALTVKGKTIAVMGTGIDKIYPSRHQSLAQEILDAEGALVSELPLGSSAQAANFPQRNRIISGLSCGVLVVEAAIKSGSLITAQIAVQQNREVFAIPGSIHNPLSRGCHQLIREGATLVETAQDIVEQLNGLLSFQRERLVRIRKKAEAKPQQMNINMAELSAVEQQIITAMGFDPADIDELVERTGIHVGSMAGQLINLEIKGLIQQIGAAYQRV